MKTPRRLTTRATRSVSASATRATRARFAPLLAAATLVAATAPGSAHATTDSYCNFPQTLSAWTLTGNAFEADNSIIRLTGAVADETSSAFQTTAVPLTATTALHAFFRFTVGATATGGDGVAFVLQNAAAGAAAIGSGTPHLGYATITPSVGIRFQATKDGTFTANSVALDLNGSATNTASATPSFKMAGSTMLYGWVDYVATTTTLSVYLSQSATKPGTAILTHTVNLFTQLGVQAYVGFTASTGASPDVNEQDVYELELSTAGIPCACEGDSACSGTPATPACGATGVCAVCSATNGTACTGATPVCDTPTATCVGCLTNANCADPTPICDSTKLTCRACASNADCGGTTPECATTGANSGECVLCIADANCPPGTQRCSTTNTCVQCLTGADCGGDTPLCSGGTCTACASDSDCSGTTPACEVWGACGQCSQTNTSQCTGAASSCDHPTGTCVGCEFNSDCSGATPICNTATHTCQPCATNADCVGSAGGPACVTTGMKTGTCVACQADSDCTSAATPKCDTTANQCVACLTSADCSGSTPVCNSSNQCVGCLTSTDCPATSPVCSTTSDTCGACQNDYSAANPGPNACPSATTPACQPSGSPLVGECLECSSLNNSACASSAMTPVCNATSGTCGCTKDSDCMPDDYCDTSTTSSGTCTAGCRVVGGTDNCATGEYCTVTTGSVGTCMGEPCNSPTDCKAPTPVCDTIVQPHECVQCINDSDCTGSDVCDTSNHCVQCTTQKTKNCSAADKGGACLGNETCGCLQDSDCGDPQSGRVCDMATSACEPGCRGTGNGCPPPQVCSSTSSTVGTCGDAPPMMMDAGRPDAQAEGGATTSSDASTSDGGSGGGSSGGCGCHLGGEGANGNGGRLALAALLGGVVMLRRRRRSRRAAA